jgi:hypothetical protein
MNAPLVALLVTLAAAIGSMRLWWMHAPRMESRYLLDYCRFTLHIPSHPLWPYRIETVQQLPITVLPDVYGRPLYQVILWPLIATGIVGIFSMFIAATLAQSSNEDRVLKGASIVSHWRWNWPLLFRRSQRGFYVDTN